MYSSYFLELVSELGKKGLFKDPALYFSQGSCLIRSYADLGIELFLMAGEKKLISLYTGSSSVMPEGHEGFFTRVPGIQDLAELILVNSYDITELEFKDQRRWRVVVRNINDQDKFIEVSSIEFETALAEILLKIVNN